LTDNEHRLFQCTV